MIAKSQWNVPLYFLVLFCSVLYMYAPILYRKIFYLLFPSTNLNNSESRYSYLIQSDHHLFLFSSCLQISYVIKYHYRFIEISSSWNFSYNFKKELPSNSEYLLTQSFNTKSGEGKETIQVRDQLIHIQISWEIKIAQM